VVATALALPPVSPQLMTPIRAPLCELAPREDYSAEEVKASLDCWKASFGDAAYRYDTLRAAVRVREKKAAELTRGT
jgi:hypothetical protein